MSNEKMKNKGDEKDMKNIPQWLVFFFALAMSLTTIVAGAPGVLHPNFDMMIDGNTVYFQDQSTFEGDNVTYTWDFGDPLGAASDATNPTYEYPIAGTYHVTLTLHREGSESSTIGKDVTVGEQGSRLDAKFIANTTMGAAPLFVQFTDTSIGDPETWQWNFGDGGISTEPNPKHTFNSAGSYMVGLTVVDADKNTATTYSTIEVSGAAAEPEKIWPEVGLESDVQEGYPPLPVHFFDNSSFATSRIWDFGDGNTSAEKDPVHTYMEAGTYTVTLTATNENGSKSAEREITVLAKPNNPDPDPEPQPKTLPVAGFIGNSSRGYAPLCIQFTDASGNATGWNWDFGDNTFSDKKNPIHTFATAGNYTVNLTVSNDNGTDSKTRVIYVIEKPPEEEPEETEEKVPPVADFTGNLSRGQVPFDVQFTDISENATGWNWDFGDGSNSIEQNPRHTYATAGNYTVNLTVTNEDGVDSKKGETIFASAKPEEEGNEEPVPDPDPDPNTNPDPKPALVVTADFSCDVEEGIAPLTVNFTGITENAVSWEWDFGDQVSSREKSPTHIFSAPGKYLVNLTARNGTLRGSKSAYITVDEPYEPTLSYPKADFSVNKTIGCIPLVAKFTDRSENAKSWKWNFGDGTASDERNPVHVYDCAGKFIVKLTVTNPNGEDSKTSEITVKPDSKSGGTGDSIGSGGMMPRPNKPVAYFKAEPCGDSPQNIRFTDLSSRKVKAWKWDFGDGITSKEARPSHRYNHPGNYTVNLTTENEAGRQCRSMLIKVKDEKCEKIKPVKPTCPVKVTPDNKKKGVKENPKSVSGFISWNPAGKVYPVNDNNKNINPWWHNHVSYARPAADEGIVSKGHHSVSYVKPAAAFIHEPHGPLSLKFTDCSTGSPIGWKWEFGDGITSTEQNPVHKYDKAGTYTVKLTVYYASVASGKVNVR